MTMHQPTIAFYYCLFLLIFVARSLQLAKSSDDGQRETKHDASIGGYLFAESTDKQLNLSDKLDATLSGVLDRNGPDMRPLRDFRDYDDITLDVAKRAWKLMRHHAQTAARSRLTALEPLVMQMIEAANVSKQCHESTLKTLTSARNLDSWAIQLLSAWGNFPPTGFFEGTYGDIGSFHGCVNVPENPTIGHAHYCTIAYRPVMPKRENYELIINSEPDELLHLFDRLPNKQDTQDQSFDPDEGDEDAFSKILRHSQYNHYVYYKFGTCFPIGCSPRDVQRLAKLLGKRSILMSGPVKCHSKFSGDYEEREPKINASSTALQISTRDLNDGIYIWKPHVTQTQWISLLIVGSITGMILVLTMLDILLHKMPQCQPRPLADLDDALSSSSSNQGKRTEVRAGKSGGLIAVSWWIGSAAEDEKDAEDDNNNSSTCAPPMKRDGVAVNNAHTYYELQATGKSRQNQVKSAERVQGFDDDDESEEISGHIDLLGADASRNQNHSKKESGKNEHIKKKQRSQVMELIDDCSIVTNVKQFFSVNPNQLKDDILCIHGIRCITMSWIIITHTMQYNDWSAFARIREIETHLKSLINQPLFNGSYLVDSFFLISGLLASYSSFKAKKRRQQKEEHQQSKTAQVTKLKEDSLDGSDKLSFKNFSSKSYLIGRYLRLTPQVMFVSLLFILLPLVKSKTGGPHWYTITGEYSENCSQNWWLNLFYIQAFYRTNEMCNFVCWWISVDMFYHLFGLVAILLILYYGHGAALLSCSILIGAHGLIQAFKHYQLALPPNLLSTIPQTGAMWSQMTLESFWTPYAHAFPFFAGFYLGYLMATRQSLFKRWFTPRRALFGWLLAISLLICQSYSTYFWVIGKWQYTRVVSTLFYLICPIVWASCLSWIIVACQYGYGSWINQVLSFLFTFFGSQNLLLEPTQIVMSYVIIGNITLSMLLGSTICIVYEMPWLKIQRRIMKHIR